MNDGSQVVVFGVTSNSNDPSPPKKKEFKKDVPFDTTTFTNTKSFRS